MIQVTDLRLHGIFSLVIRNSFQHKDSAEEVARKLTSDWFSHTPVRQDWYVTE